MIWYLLSPLRGTADPPRLSDDNFIRRAFYRHGILTAQHWLASMLVSCGIAAALAYPTVFISGNPTAGFTSKPHQIWAASRTVSHGEDLNVDIEMRQIWVHGTYMQALDKDVLQSALRIQQTLVGDEDLTTVSDPVSWGFHSPLMYWNNSADAIQSDLDIAKTINDRAGSPSSLEVSLRPASVFAGKTFAHRKLVAADALVLTLMNRADDGVGQKWQDKMHSLGDVSCPQCQLYPPRGQISPSWLYEFTFTPVTLRENTALALAYAAAVLYVLLSLRRLKAFHSRFGLVVTVVAQMVMSVLASFTICGMLKVNLTAVPRNAYPLILLVIGLENMFRLINAILAYPPTMATDLRIANALGDVGPLSVATAAQNLITLWLLSRVVSPGIVAFCAFAAVATLVDTFFLLTFFVAVLNVDIRRLELQDSISRAKDASQRTKSPTPARSWFDALLYGGLPLSTRMAGSIVTTSFILTLNFLFFERTEKKVSLQHIIGLVRGRTQGLTDFDSLAPPPMNATVTPGEWIRMQDFDTAREVMRLVNEGAQSFVIRVFAPLMIVLSGADRTGVPLAQAWADDLRTFTFQHLYPFLVVVIFIVTFVAVLMNFLLWNEAPEVSEELPERNEEAISIEHVQTCHKLDIVKLSANKGNIISAALDRTVNISTLDRSQGMRSSVPLSTELLSAIRWPVHDIAIDDSGHYVAFHSGDDVMICNRQTNTIEKVFQYPDHQPSALFDFVSMAEITFVALTAGGQLVVQSLEKPAVSTSLGHGHIIAATVTTARSNSLVTLHDDGKLQSCELGTESAHITASISLTSGIYVKTGKISTVADDHLIWTPGQLFMLSQDLHLTSSHKLLAADMYLPSFNADKYAAALRQPDSESVKIISASRPADSLAAASAEVAEPNEFVLDNPGSWLSLPHEAILGMRRRVKTSNGATAASQLRRRRMSGRSEQQSRDRRDIWEVYSLTIAGDLSSTEFDALGSSADPEQPLFVTKAEPTIVLDGSSATFAFGNSLKIVRLSKSRAHNGKIERHGSTRKRGSARKAL